MLKQTIINKKVHTISKDASKLFPDDQSKAGAIASALEMMNDCLDYFYGLVKPIHKNVFRPELYASTSAEVNACARDKYIFIYSGLVMKVVNVIENKYTDEVLDKYSILKSLNRSQILSGLRVYTWRYIALHELFHLWHSHAEWRKKYRFVEDRRITTWLPSDQQFSGFKEIIEETVSYANSGTVSSEIKQLYITQQALELDSDCCAISMMINMLMRDADARFSQGMIKDKKEYIVSEIGLMMGALATVFSIFDGNAGAQFEILKQDLDCMSHPIPAIRMYVAEDVADAMLWKYYPDRNERFEIEKEWQHIVCDIEPYYEGEIDMGRVFYFTAYTERAQKHLAKLRYRLKDMHRSLESLVVYPLAEEMADEDIEYDSQVIRFSDEGISLKGWINPATGKNTAIKAK